MTLVKTYKSKLTQDQLQLTPHLHGDDPEVVLLPAPHQEGLGVVVEDAPPSWPITASICSLQESVSLL